jgi:hypothetical protein
MALTLSNQGIAAGQIVKASEISQSIDAFTGAEAYDITLSGSLYLPDNTHMGIGVLPSAIAGTKIHLKGGDATQDPLILLEGFNNTDSATVGFKNNQARWDVGLAGGSQDSFIINNTDVSIPSAFLIDYSSSNALIARNPNGTEASQQVGINWPYGQMAGTQKTLHVSGSITASGKIYGESFTFADGTEQTTAGGGGGTPGGVNTQVQFNNNGNFDGSSNFLFDGNNVTAIGFTGSLEGTSSWAGEAFTSSIIRLSEGNIPFGNAQNISTQHSTLKYFFSSNELYAPEMSASVFQGGHFTGSAVSASEAGVTMRIDKNNIYSDRPNRMYIGNESTNSNASLMFVVGGTGTSANSAILINSNQEVMFGNPATAYSYPLGFNSGEIGSYGQFTNNNADSASLLAIMGTNGDSDGLLYVGSDDSKGGGMSFRGDAAGGYGNLLQLNANNIEIYRADPTTEDAIPVISIPTSEGKNIANININSSNNLSNAPEYFGLAAHPTLNTIPFRRTYPIPSFTLGPGSGNPTAIEIPCQQAGSYVITLYLNDNAGGFKCHTLKKIFLYGVNISGATPVQENGSPTSIYDFGDASLQGNVTAQLVAAVAKVELEIINNALTAVAVGGYVEVDFLPVP